MLFETGHRMLLFFNKGAEDKLAPEKKSVASIYSHMPVHTDTAVIMAKKNFFEKALFVIKSG